MCWFHPFSPLPSLTNSVFNEQMLLHSYGYFLLHSCFSVAELCVRLCSLMITLCFVCSIPTFRERLYQSCSVNWRLFSSLPLVDRSCACVLKPAPSSGCSGVKGLWWKRGRYSALAKLCKTFRVVFSCLVLQVLLPSSHASSWV